MSANEHCVLKSGLSKKEKVNLYSFQFLNIWMHSHQIQCWVNTTQPCKLFYSIWFGVNGASKLNIWNHDMVHICSINTTVEWHETPHASVCRCGFLLCCLFQQVNVNPCSAALQESPSNWLVSLLLHKPLWSKQDNEALPIMHVRENNKIPCYHWEMSF